MQYQIQLSLAGSTVVQARRNRDGDILIQTSRIETIIWGACRLVDVGCSFL